MYIPFVYEHLFYKYFVRRSVGQATKGKRASLLMDVVILVLSKTSKLYSVFFINVNKDYAIGYLAANSIEG